MTVSRETIIMDDKGMRRSLLKIAHEILARNEGAENLALLGLQTRGVFMAQRIAAMIVETEGVTVPVGVLDVTMYRDDFRNNHGCQRENPVRSNDYGFSVFTFTC